MFPTNVIPWVHRGIKLPNLLFVRTDKTSDVTSDLKTGNSLIILKYPNV